MKSFNLFSKYKRFSNFYSSLCILLYIMIVFSFLGCGDDQVRFNNTSGNQSGVLVDGQSSTGQVNDRTRVTLTDVVTVGSLEPGTSNEVVAFTNHRPAAIRTSVPWTGGEDDITVDFPNKISIPVTVWIVKGPFNTQRDKAIDACITTASIWNNERMGLQFNPFDIIDATGDPDAPNYFTFDCSKRTGIQNDIGRTSGRINIYYVDTVDGGTGRGQACAIGSDFVAMGRNTGDELLSHELGHDFDLTHIDDLTSDFDQTNIMHSASNTREFITEGQVFRAHLNPESAINDTYGARPGLLTRDCLRNDFNNQCPDIKKRIWDDGTFSAN